MANAAVYARVSIRDQELDTQRGNLLGYARGLGLNVDASSAAATHLAETVVSETAWVRLCSPPKTD